ncbi:MAG: HNH endonuclease [Acidobacteria bacterium]|nr:HNH endonuclease [Acidobacteriota bacterium]
MSHLRHRSVGADTWGKPDRDREGRAICRWCRTPVTPPRRTFCGDACVHEWRIRSDISYARRLIWKRDRGVCQRCLVDLLKAFRNWKRSKPRTRSRQVWREWRSAEPRWEVDHIVPVADGGGECGLSNLRLLCRACHVAVTQAWIDVR